MVGHAVMMKSPPVSGFYFSVGKNDNIFDL